MATQSNVHTFTKKIGNVRGYKKRNTKKSKQFESLKGGASKSTFQNSPSMARTRENANEFGGAGLQTKSINNALKLRYKESAGVLNNKLQKLNVSIIKNSEGIRGKRKYDCVSNKPFFKNFKVGHLNIDSVFTANYSLTSVPGKNSVTIEVQSISTNDIYSPKGATHFALSVGLFSKSNAEYDEDTKKYTITSINGDLNLKVLSNSSWLELGKDITLPTSITAEDLGKPICNDEIVLVVFGIKFAQKVGAEYYEFSQNFAATVVEVL